MTMPVTSPSSGAAPRRPLSRVIAVTGSDGAGKSTLTADLVGCLGRERRVAFVYLGQSSGNIRRAIEALPLIGAPIGRALVRRGERAHAKEDKSERPDIVAALVMYLLSRWRFHKFRRVLALDRRGVTVVTDRWPQAEVPGFYFDGPGIAAAGPPAGFVRWLARREWRLYQRMARHVPALLIRLDIDAETAHARKPDHKLAMLRDKASVIPRLSFNGARILALDAREPYPEVLEKALEAARSLPGA